MTKVAAVGQLHSSNSLHLGGGSSAVGGSKVSNLTLKRKTPTEMRGELLKRNNLMELVDESPAPLPDPKRNTNEEVSEPKKTDPSKAPRYTETRMNGLFPVTKNRTKLEQLSRKENFKGPVPSMCIGTLKESGSPMDLKAKCQAQGSIPGDTAGIESSNQASNTTKKSSKITFQSVRELSLGAQNLNASSLVDMDKALKGLVTCEPHTASSQLADLVGGTGHMMPKSFVSEFHAPGPKMPLDLTLKTNIRILSTSSVKWFHKSANCDLLNGMVRFSSVSSPSQSMSSSSEPTCISQMTNPGTFHSWVHPQPTFPRSVITALTSAPGGHVDFFAERRQAWEDSFRSLYYMLRKKICKIFYVCTEQFIVMFTGSDGSKETTYSYDAYISQSTRNFRSLLTEHGISFSMPLCHSKVEEVVAEDLLELSEMEKYDLGQTHAIDTMTGVDNSPESLLMFTGKNNLHGLFDFLLNYRNFLTSLTGGDVPVLYSPVPFKNAALSAPEVKCQEVRRADYIPSQLKASATGTAPDNGSSTGLYYSVEVRDAYIPPWVTSGIFNAMCSNGGDFQASFVTETMSLGLNVSMNQPAQQTIANEQSDYSFGILNTTVSPHMHSAFLKGLKYCSGSYTASVTPVA